MSSALEKIIKLVRQRKINSVKGSYSNKLHLDKSFIKLNFLKANEVKTEDVIIEMKKNYI